MAEAPTRSTTNSQHLAQRVDRLEDSTEKHSEILTKLTAIVEMYGIRLGNVETDIKTSQATLVEIGKALVRYEERDAHTQRWIGVVVSFAIALAVGVAMFVLGYFIHH